VTSNGGGDSLPDAWIDTDDSPYPVRPAGPVGPAHVLAARGLPPAAPAAGRLVVNARFLRGATVPEPQTILPYRHALIVNEYEVMDVVDGAYADKTIRVAQWGIRDGRVVPGATRQTGTASTLLVERYDAHGELEGERVISASEGSTLPLYYELPQSS
jgi:hypothetical protein